MTVLKVAQIITGFGTGGAERLLLDMSAKFDRARFDVKLVSITADLSALEVYGYPDAEIAVFDLGRDRLRTFSRLRAFLAEFSPAVVHAHMFHALVVGVAATRSIGGRPPAIVFTSHLNNYAPLRALMTRALKPWRAADIIFAVGQHRHLNAGQTYVIPNGVPVPAVPPNRQPWVRGGPIRMLAVGRIADQKDPLGMLRAFSAAAVPNSTLDFIGDGPLMPDAISLAIELGLQERVTFHGVRSDVGRFLQQSDIFVMHSKYEGMPIALLEAAAQAMPVVATPVGAVGQVLGDNGVLATPQTFPAALASLCAEPDRALAMGRALHTHVFASHSIEATTAAHEAIYERVATR